MTQELIITTAKSKYKLVFNPYDDGDNTLNITIIMPDGSDGATSFKHLINKQIIWNYLDFCYVNGEDQKIINKYIKNLIFA